MNTQIAVSLGLVIVGLLIVDSVLYDWDNSIFLMRKQSELIEYLAFWR